MRDLNGRYKLAMVVYDGEFPEYDPEGNAPIYAYNVFQSDDDAGAMFDGMIQLSDLIEKEMGIGGEETA